MVQIMTVKYILSNFVVYFAGEKKNTRQEQFGNSGYGVLKKLKKEGLCLSEAALEVSPCRKRYTSRYN